MFSSQRHTDSSRRLAAPTLESEPATFRVLAAERKELAGLSLIQRTLFDRSASDESEGADAAAEPSVSLGSLLSRRRSDPRSIRVSPPTLQLHSSSQSQSAQVSTVNLSLFSNPHQYQYAGIGDHNSQRSPRHELVYSSRLQSDYSHAYSTAPTGQYDYPSTTRPGLLSGSGSAPSGGDSVVTSTRPDVDVIELILKRRYGYSLRDAVRGTRERMEPQYALSMWIYNQVTPALVALGIISNVIALCLILRALRSRSRY